MKLSHVKHIPHYLPRHYLILPAKEETSYESIIVASLHALWGQPVQYEQSSEQSW